MRGFLFDENLPRVPFLQTSLPVTYALDLGSRPTHSRLWAQARQNDLAIVTKDADFSQRIVLGVPPPRVVHLRVGNMRGRDFAAWLFCAQSLNPCCGLASMTSPPHLLAGLGALAAAGDYSPFCITIGFGAHPPA